MALGDRRGYVDHRAVAAAGVVAKPVERLALGHVVALHEDALGPLDERTPLERGLEALDLLDQLALLLVAAHGHLDRRLDRVGPALARVGGDAAGGCRADEVRVLLLEDRDHRAAGELGDLLDELERVPVVLVDDDHRHVRVIPRDHLGRLLHADRHLGDLVAEVPHHRSGDAQRALVLVGEQHLEGAQMAVVMGEGHWSRTIERQPTLRQTVGSMWQSGLTACRPSRARCPGASTQTRAHRIDVSFDAGPNHPAVLPAGMGSVTHQRPVAGDPPSRSSDRSTEDRALFERYLDKRDPVDRELLVERFLPLARQLARRYQRPEEPFDDLFQVACLGLVKAIDRFDLSRDVAFSSYAVPTILGEIKRYFRDRTWSVRVPRDLQELALRVDRKVSELSTDLRRQPTVSEIAEAVGIEEEDVLEALEASGAYRATSLSTPRGNEDEAGETLGDTVGTSEEGFGLAENRATLEQLMRAVTPREREVLRLRFEEDLTQAEIGERIGVSQMQVSRIIRQSIARLRTVARTGDDRPPPRRR